MKVIICGAGQVGWQIARHLSGEKNDVTVVDSNPELVRRATDTLDVQGVTGFASHPDVLERAGARDCDLLIAATYSDEVNMVTCQVGHSVFNITRKIARVRNQSYMRPEYGDLYRRDHLPIDVIISPEREVAEAVAQGLSNKEIALRLALTERTVKAHLAAVFDKLSSGMDDATRDWLAAACAPLDRTPAALAA